MTAPQNKAAISFPASAASLLADYDVVFCDIWGVVHDGRTAYPKAMSLLTDYRQRGGIVVLVSNAPRLAETVAAVLDEKSVARASWDAITSSGTISANHVNATGWTAVHHLGPDRDLDLFDGIKAARCAMGEAEAIVATGLIHDRTETGEDYRDQLREPAARGLPFICANPDLIVDVGGTLLPCAGAIAKVYEDLGGPVFWAGKPYLEAYEAAHKRACELAGRDIAKSRIIAIGDAERTDIAGAAAFGIDAIFIGQGIHRGEVMPNGRTLDVEAVEALFADTPHRPIAALPTLC